MSFRLVPLALVIAVSSACITGGPRRTTPEQADNGQPLEVRTTMVDNYDNYPNLKLRLKNGTQSEVFDGFYQGAAPVLDELDFYAIAKDEARLARVVEWREKFNTALSASYVAQTVGVLVVASGIGVGAYGFSVDPDNIGNSPFYGAALGLVIGGSIIVGGAPSILYDLLGPEGEPDESFEKTPLVISYGEAAGSAGDYNRALKGGDTTADAPADGADGAGDDGAAP